LFQPFQSPTTFTIIALGAQTGELRPTRLQMRAQVLVQPELGAFVEEVEIVVGEE